MKVLHLLNYPGNGGSEKYILTLAEKLHHIKCDFMLGYAMEGPMLAELKKLDIPAIPFPMSSPYDLNAALRLKRLCAEHKIDIVHTHFLRENYIAIFSKLFGNKIKLVNTSHLVTEKSKLLRISNRLLTKMDDRIIAVCMAGKNQMQAEGLDSGRIEVIHNGVDFDYWSEDTESTNSTIRRELALEDSAFVVASTARFTEEKGHDFLINTIAKIKSSSNARNIKFILAGNGELLEQNMMLAKKLNLDDMIHFLGYRTDIRNILKSSNLFVSPSKSEALSMSIIEACAAGLPVIATDVGGTSEVINEKTGCGTLVRYGDVDSFADSIIKYYTNSPVYENAKVNAIKNAKENFSLEKTVAKTYELYEKIISQK